MTNIKMKIIPTILIVSILLLQEYRISDLGRENTKLKMALLAVPDSSMNFKCVKCDYSNKVNIFSKYQSFKTDSTNEKK